MSGYFIRLRVFAIAMLLLSPLLLAQQALNNASIIKMVKAGLSADIVVAAVKAQPGNYDLSPDSLIALKKAGASDPIIAAMISRNAPPAAAQDGGGTDADAALGPNGLPAGVDSVGMYYKDKDNNWTEVDAEVVNFKTGGALKHISTVGIVKGDLNGHVAAYHSKLTLSAPADFLLYVPEGTSPGEYQLIRFRVASDSREFRALTGGVAHTSGGAARDTVDFTTKKIAPRLYAVTLAGEIGKGEYGFLPPQESTGKNIENSGKIYTFSFVN